MANLNEYQKAILDIATKVDGLVIDADILTRFTGHIDNLCKMVEESGNHLEQCLNDPKLRINVKAEEKLTKKMDKLSIEVNALCHKFNNASQTGDQQTVKQIDKLLKEKNQQHEKLVAKRYKPPASGYVRYSRWDWIFLTVPHAKYPCWLKPGSVNPLLWFGIFGNASLQRKPKDNEKLMCKYVLLAIIHDNELLKPTDSHIIPDEYKGKWFKRDEFCEDFWAYYYYNNQSPDLLHYPATAQEKLSQLNRALEHVQADLASTQKNGGQASGNAGETNRQKKWTVDLANEAIFPVIQKYGKTPNVLTARFLEENTGCPHSTLAKTNNWGVLEKIKKQYRNEQGKMQRKPVHLSNKTLSIAEQTQDGTVKLHTSHKKKNIEGDD